MVLTKSELLDSLQKEVRILLHLAEKVDRAQLDYRPTPKQRSTLELLQYLTMMGPWLIRFAKGEKLDGSDWTTAAAAAGARNFDETVAALAAMQDGYARQVGEMPDTAFREEVKNFDGSSTTRGAFIVHQVLSGHAAYRTQLFMYLKACGREELNTYNLWMGVDPPAPAAAV